ncbi:MAG: SDR family oxidoreductase [Verrucomicrobiae bacterium]|nr:SDR family oxidoreductase [Verrucomicrobiae bacterium]
MPRTILIAGGNSGIGLEIVKRLAAQPDTQVVCALRHPGPLADLANVTTLPFDATDPAPDLAGLPETLDGFVYCPGTISLKPFHRLSDEDFLLDLQVNFLGAVRLLRSSLPALKRADSAGILFFSTVAVSTGMPFHTSIAAAKGAVEAFARSLAAELAPKIRVNVIAPSLTQTPLAGNLLNSDEKVEASQKRHPLRQVGDPADFAAAVEFFLSDHAKFMTGQVIPIDGGLSSIRLL